jgi:hypothetical protein
MQKAAVAAKTAGPAAPAGVTWLAAAAILFLAVLCRFPDPERWPIKFHPTRQYHGAIAARKIWMALQSGRFTAAQKKWAEETPAFIEPPLLEALTVITYLPDGTERPWTSGVIATICWFLGGWFLFQLARDIGDELGAWFSVTFYLFAPTAILVSQSFQPEALMVLGFLACLWYLVRSDVANPSWRDTFLAGAACGLAGLIKPGVLIFPFVGAYLSLALKSQRRQSTSAFRLRALLLLTALFAVLCALPSVLYGLTWLRSQVGEKVFPRLLLTTDFYLNWWSRIEYNVPFLFVAGALLGAFALRAHPRAGYLGWGVLAGYVAYGMTFTWHTMTHTYYATPLVPIIALLLAPLACSLLQWIGDHVTRLWVTVAGVVALLGTCLYISWYAILMAYAERPAPAQIRTYEEIGRAVGEGASVLSISEDYGLPLTYHGWVNAHFWPTRVDLVYEKVQQKTAISTEQRLAQLRAEHHPSHFVVTDMDEWPRHPDLARILERYPVSYSSPRGIIFDLRETATSVPSGSPRPGG